MLTRLKTSPGAFTTFATNLWKEMRDGTDFSTAISGEAVARIAKFNGGLFDNPTALPLDGQQITLLLHAARQDWSEVEPAIFGTLLERALDPRERHKLGAHYTPASYVNRLLEPTLIQPLREQWQAVKTAAAVHYTAAIEAEHAAETETTKAAGIVEARDSAKARATGKRIAKHQREARANRAAAIAAVTDFHHQLCETRILDPACGSGNFLYLALAGLKALEAEILDLLREIAPFDTLTAEIDSFKVRPDQFFGLEINPNAVAIAQLVLWIGYFQWHRKATGKADTNERPLLPKQQTIECRDAVLASDKRIPQTDNDGKPLTIWDGHTTKPHPVTGKEVPDESARKLLFTYNNPKRTTWPEAEYIVGNPPFLGTSRMRNGLGDGYVEALRTAFKKHRPDSWDFVMFWWHQAAELVRGGKTKRFGFITTNSIHQTFNRRCLEAFLNNEKKPVSLAFAIPDHPWVDSADGAAVRIAMTVAGKDAGEGVLAELAAEREVDLGEHEVDLETRHGRISADLTFGANLTQVASLEANGEICCPGVKLHGSGFIVTRAQAEAFGLEKIEGLENHIRSYRNGKDLTSIPRGVLVIDLFGLASEEVAKRFPAVFQYLLTAVKPDRDQNKRTTYRDNWWIFGEPRRSFRPALAPLPRYIATPETSKHRFFTFLDQSILPDNMLVNVALDDACFLGILTSSIHVQWALAAGGRLGMGNDPRYNKTRCFETFPFPVVEDGSSLQQTIRDLGERLDAHRKARQAEHAGLTLTGMYNVMEKLRGGETLTDKDKTIHEQGLVTLLKQIHDELDAAVLDAYGWQDLDPLHPSFSLRALGGEKLPLADRLARGDEELEQSLLQRLVDLNHERAEEEQRGLVRHLRPAFQDPEGTQSITPASSRDTLALSSRPTTAHPPAKAPWPESMPKRVLLIQRLVSEHGSDPAALSASFTGRNTKKRQTDIAEIIATLRNLGHIE